MCRCQSSELVTAVEKLLEYVAHSVNQSSNVPVPVAYLRAISSALTPRGD